MNLPDPPHGFPVTGGVISMDFAIVQDYCIELRNAALKLEAELAAARAEIDALKKRLSVYKPTPSRFG